MQAFATSQLYLQTRSAQDNVETLATRAMARCPHPLSKEDTANARTAWAFFQTFTDPTSGLAPAIGRGNAVTPWEIGATLLAIVCAGRLGVIPAPVMRDRLHLCLASVALLPLGKTGLPGLKYGMRDRSPLAPDGTPAARPDGWSARAIARLISGLIVTAHHAPELAPQISAIISGWDLAPLIHNGRFRSGHLRPNAAPKLIADLFLGYEQYAARTACLINLGAGPALDPRPVLRLHIHEGLTIAGDKRLGPGRFDAITLEPFFLEALEFGWRPEILEIALGYFLAQKGRFERTGTLTAHTEDALDRPPGFAFHAMLAGDRPFTSVSRTGNDLSQHACLSTKAAFCWQALLPTPYSQKLKDAVGYLQTPNGWQAGRYENGGGINTAMSLNTNAVILEALHFQAHGPLFALQ